MLNGDDNGYLKRDIYDYIEEEADRNLMLTPEQYAIGNKI